MSPQVLFNQFAYIDRLKRGGFSDEQARASAEALGDAFTEAVATKSDLGRLEAAFERLEGKFERLEGKFERLDGRLTSEIDRLDSRLTSEIERLGDRMKSEIDRLDGKIERVEVSLKAELKSEIASVKVDVIRWVLMLNVAAVGLLFAAMKLFK